MEQKLNLTYLQVPIRYGIGNKEAMKVAEGLTGRPITPSTLHKAKTEQLELNCPHGVLVITFLPNTSKPRKPCWGLNFIPTTYLEGSNYLGSSKK